MANSVEPDQTALEEQSDLGLHCFLRPVCPSTYIFYGIVSRHKKSFYLVQGVGRDYELYRTNFLINNIFIFYYKEIRSRSKVLTWVWSLKYRSNQHDSMIRQDD